MMIVYILIGIFGTIVATIDFAKNQVYLRTYILTILCTLLWILIGYSVYLLQTKPGSIQIIPSCITDDISKGSSNV